jgi:serine/threonine protein kinase
MRRVSSQPPELPGYGYLKVLGSGGFSDVFLYEQQLPKRRVAVKVLLTEELTATNRAAFVSEANVMAQLSTHPYIVTIYQADVALDDRPYFVMEYCSGPSLSERYKKETFTVADALRTGVRLSSAVATAHAAGILHRDIKPGNVLTNDYGWPALTDFGISSAVEEDAFPMHTGTLADALAEAQENTGTSGTGASVGMSVPWSPPEMFEDDPAPDVRSDIFSLAATIYTILAGHTPFEVRGQSNGTLDLIGRIERGAITPIDRDDIPASLTAVLRKGMASSRDDRFATAVDFARALQRVELELGYAPTTIDVPNLHIEAPSRDAQTDDADATRARTVSTIAVQAPVRAAVIQPPPSAAVDSAGAESTRLRSPVSIEQTVLRPRVAPVETEAPVEVAPIAVPAKSRRGLLIGLIVGVLVVAGGVTAIVIPKGTAVPPPPADSQPHDGGTIDVSTVPVPVEGLAVDSADGTSVIFTWKNPKPKSGDAFIWARAETPTKNTQTKEATATVTGVVPGSKTCINVSVSRNGVGSPNPLVVCDR